MRARPSGKRTQAEGEAGANRRLRLRLLVLQAKRIPYQYEQDTASVYVPRLYLGVAAHEILSFENERDAAMRPAPGKDNWLWVLAVLSLLLFWDAMRYGAGGWGLHFLPLDSKLWAELGALAKAEVLAGEWWRAFTALTLHADASHVLGNCVFGALFMLPLCSRAGLGGGVFMTLMGGALGNALNIFFQPDATVSIGFSTAVFAALGALCGLAAYGFYASYAEKRHVEAGWVPHETDRERPFASALAPAGVFLRFRARGVFLCLAAGLAFLAFLGGSGEPQVDFSAHALGLLGGLLISLPLAPFLTLGGSLSGGSSSSSSSSAAAVAAHKNDFIPAGQSRLHGRPAQVLLLLIPLGLVALSWYLAFAGA